MPFACSASPSTPFPPTSLPSKDTSMFTGIIEELGAVESVVTRSAGARIQVRCSTVMEGVKEGASIAVNGVCLTALDLRPDGFFADMAPETLRRSNLGDL